MHDMHERQFLNRTIYCISNLRVYNVLQATDFRMILIETLSTYIRGGCACKCAYLLGLRNKWEKCLPLKTSVSIMQTKYEILIYRKQVLLQPILYINGFIHSYCLQTKYVCIEIFLEVLFSAVYDFKLTENSIKV